MSYENFVLNYHRYTKCARSYDEAFKTADYATPIWRCETQNEKWLRDNSAWMITLGVVIGFAFLVYPTLLWIINR